MEKRTALISLVVIVALVGFWRYWMGRVNRNSPEQVATAFVAALKSHDLDKAADFWVPDGAEAWQARAAEKIGQMQSGSQTRFFEDLPEKPVFTQTHAAGAGADEQTLTSGDTAVDLRQLEGKWYVCKGPP
ncbi:MAG: hypothetical protein ACREJC_19375 [Tepidisphaeraceae bacterium]